MWVHALAFDSTTRWSATLLAGVTRSNVALSASDLYRPASGSWMSNFPSNVLSLIDSVPRVV
jgi:hypothetical protein